MISQSMAAAATASINAVAESFFATLKNELIHGRSRSAQGRLRTTRVLSRTDDEHRTLNPGGTRFAARIHSQDRVHNPECDRRRAAAWTQASYGVKNTVRQ